MAKPKTIFACQSCGYQSPKWLGRCPDCNQWNSFAEEELEKASTARGELSLGTKEDPAPIHEIRHGRRGPRAFRHRRVRPRPRRRAWCPARSFSSAAIPASANRLCSCKPSPRLAKKASPASMFPAKNRSARSKCARNGWASKRRICSSSAKLLWSASSITSRKSNPGCW